MYADPTRCPDCGGPIPPHPVACAACGLPLTGADAVALFVTLQRADQLVARLRAPASTPSVGPAPSVEPVETTAAPPYPPDPPAPSVEPAETTAPAAIPPRRGLSGASVPKILLGLGALCLLVAAIIFLAVAWTWLGVGGRTGVLVGLTGLSGGLAAWTGHRGLRVAAESFSVVALGLLALDVVGAHNAGWLGELDTADLMAVTGTLVGGLAYGITWVTSRPESRRPARPLIAPQVVSGLALAVVPLGLSESSGSDATVFSISCLAFLALATVAHRLRIGWLDWVMGALAVIWWLPLLTTAISRVLDDPTWTALWRDGQALPALAAAGLVLLVAFLFRARAPLAAPLAGVGATLVTLTVAVPPLAGTADEATLTMLVFVVAWALALLGVPRAWRAAPAVPMLASSAVPAAVALAQAGETVVELLTLASPWTVPASVRLGTVDTPGDPLLLVATTVVGAFAVTALARYGSSPARFAATYGVFLGTGVALSVVLSLAAYPIPLVAVVGSLLLVAGLLLAWALPRPDSLGVAGLALALLVALGALASALPSVVLTLVASLALLVLAAVVALRGAGPAHRMAGSALVPWPAGLAVWAVADLAGLEDSWRGLPLLVVVGALALAWPRPQVEIPAAIVGTLGSLVAVSAAFVESESEGLLSLALHLTLAGVLVTASALIHPERRKLGYAGGLLLAMASWVRLYDLGVSAPEAYTMPSAVVLVLLGLRRMWRDPEAPTLPALGPGLALATVPSLLQVLGEDPVSWRALLLGLGCLALVLVGTYLRWNAPLVVGAVVGAVLVLVELGPYAAVVPLWVVIAAAGTILTVAGVTWEHRLQNLRDATAYLARLR